MSFAPDLHVGLVPEGQNGGTEVVNVVPRCSWGNGKMHPEIFFLDLAFYDVDIDVFHLAAKSGVDHRVPAHQGGNTATTPDTGGPPTLIAFLNPRGRRGKGERVDNPGLANMGVQYDTVAFGQAGQSLFDFLDRLCQGG